jgi:3-oxoisoapionate decarboxylase
MDKRSMPTRRECLFYSAGVVALATGASPGRAAGEETSNRRPPTPQAGGKLDVLVPPRLGLDTYALHRTLTAKDASLRKDLWWVIDQLAELRLTGLQIDPSHFPGLEEETLGRLREAVRPHGYYVEFGMGGWDIERLRQRIKLTARFGGRALRTFCGDERNTPEQLSFFLEAAPPAFRQAAETAEEYGVDIAIENHGDFTTAQMKQLIERADHPRVGICFDTANALFRDEDPLASAKELLPYTNSMHLKDWTMSRAPDGSHRWTEAVLGEGQVPIREILRMAVQMQPGLYIALETPVWPSDDERETVEREQRHVAACARAANRFLQELGVSHAKS